MKSEKLLLNRREHELIWYLSKKGLQQINSNNQVKYVKNNIYHYIMRNQVYVHYRPRKWQTEKSIQFGSSKEDIIRPDAIMETDKIYFVEIDHTQSMKINRDKIEKYKQIKGLANFTLMFITISEYRQKELRGIIENMKSEVLLYNDIL